MIKKILLLTVLLLIIAYLVIALTNFNSKPENQVCRKLGLVIKDSVNAGLITHDEIASVLKRKGLYPVGKKMDDIRTKALERQLNKHPLIEDAECYKTPGGAVCVEIKQRLPILRVMSNNGDDYYVDNKGKVMPPLPGYVVHLAIVTGNVDKRLVTKELYKFGIFLQNNEFWNAQIEQINITPDKEIELVPRVGDHLVFLGKLDNFEERLDKLKTFYGEALNEVGWNKYTRISLEFNNQIICTKKEN